MRRLSLIVLALFSFAVTTTAAAQDLSFEVAAPMSVNAGEPFRIEFSIGAVSKDVVFTPPEIEGIDVLAGPQESRRTDIRLINGDFTKTETTTYTYVLQGVKTGLYTVSAARATVKGKTYSSRPTTIEVLGDPSVERAAADGGNDRSERQNAGGQSANDHQDSTAPREVSADDIFMRATIDQSEVYKGEPVVVTLKLYSRVQFGVDDLKTPSFNGFWQQDISGDAVERRETYDGRVYNTWTIKEYLLYPQQAGHITIDPFEASVTVRFQIKNAPRSIFDEMMGGGVDYRDVRKKLTTPPIKVNVREWPTGAPASFTGAVGRFELSTTPPPSAINANASGSYTMKLEGTGNFPLIRAPRLELPASFEEYNVTSSDNTSHGRNGTKGYREFSYPFIPRAEGTYTIPAFQFSFFDPGKGHYVTLSSREMTMEVAADSTAVAAPGGVVSGLSREELKIFGQDIRFIKRGAPMLHPKGKTFMWSPVFIALIAILVALFAAGYFVLQRSVRNRQSDRFVRGKRANKLAVKRFRIAERSMIQGDKHGFYYEMLKALWGYMSDKLDIPMADLSKERVREELFERAVSQVQADEYIRIISECEQAQYSPAPSERMAELYREGVDLVSELESAIKRR